MKEKECTYPDRTGLVFHHKDEWSKAAYWKITGPPRFSLGRWSYPTVKCTKLGKEFKFTNGFSCDYIERLVTEGQKDATVIATGVPENKVDLEAGIESGKRLRRIQFLQARMKRDREELAELEADRMRQLCS